MWRMKNNWAATNINWVQFDGWTNVVWGVSEMKAIHFRAINHIIISDKFLFYFFCHEIIGLPIGHPPLKDLILNRDKQK